MTQSLNPPPAPSPTPHRARRALALFAAGVALAVGPAPAAAQAQIDNFDDGDDLGWTRFDSISSQVGAAQNTWSFPTGRYRLQASPTPLAAAGPGRVASLRQDVVYGSFHISVDLWEWDPARTNAMGLIARVQPNPGFATLSGYVFGYVSGDNYLALVRVDGERTRGIAGSLPYPITLTPGRGYRLTFTGKGPEMVGRLYDLADLNNPLAEVPASDGNYVEGTAGVLAFAVNAGALGPADVTFDDYAASDRDRPRLRATIEVFGEQVVRWPRFEGDGYGLQGTISLGADLSWEDIPEGSIFADPFSEDYLFDASVSVYRFFRLKK